MSLTKKDLQAIGNLIDERLEIKFDEKITPIWNELTIHTKRLKKLQRKATKIDWTVTYISKTFDERIVQNMKDIQNLKQHLSPSRRN